MCERVLTTGDFGDFSIFDVEVESIWSEVECHGAWFAIDFDDSATKLMFLAECLSIFDAESDEVSVVWFCFGLMHEGGAFDDLWNLGFGDDGVAFAVLPSLAVDVEFAWEFEQFLGKLDLVNGFADDASRVAGVVWLGGFGNEDEGICGLVHFDDF